jgi:hypothetical protein
MKSLFTGLVVMTLAALTGCSQGTPGGPGATEKKPAFGQADDTFNLSVPVLSSSVQQGEQTEATVGSSGTKRFTSLSKCDQNAKKSAYCENQPFS